MKKAVIYARYSSDAQTEQSIDGQLRECQNYAQRNSIIIVDTYIDRAMTGTNDNRAAFQKMMRDSAKGQWEIVLVYKLDRFSRYKYEMVIHRKTLRDNGVRIVSAMENIPDSPEGVLMESVLEGFNQYYSEELRQKVNRGFRESWLKGNATGGKPLLGYDIQNKKYVINEKEAAIVREIFERYATGEVADSIASSLTAQGKYRKNGKPFDQHYVYKVLRNKRYVGEVTHQGVVYDNIFPPVITLDLWNKVESIHEENKIAPSRKKDKFDFLLSDKTICGVCGRRKHGVSGTAKSGVKHAYYSCRDKSGVEKCACKPIRKDCLEEMVVNTTLSLLNNQNTIDQLSRLIFEAHQRAAQDNATLNLLKQQREETHKAGQNILKAIEMGIINDMTKTRFAEIETQLTLYDTQIEQEQQRCHTSLTLNNIKTYLSQYVFADTANKDVQKTIVNTFVRNVIVYVDHIVIVYNFVEPQDYTPQNATTLKEVERSIACVPPMPYSSLSTHRPPKKRALGSLFCKVKVSELTNDPIK